MHRLRIFILVIVATCALRAQDKQTTEPGGPVSGLKGGFDLDALDRSVDPCVDFYRYACGNWLKANPVPPDRSLYGRFSELEDRNRTILAEILEKVSDPHMTRTANEQKTGDYYASCMDESGIEQEGTGVLEPEFARIAALKRKEELAALIGHFSRIGVTALVGFGEQQDPKDSTQQIAVVGQGGFGLPERDFYFRDDSKSVETRKQYLLHAQHMFELFGEKQPVAAAHAQTVMRLETALAKGSLDAVSLRDPTKIYHKTGVKDLQLLTPVFDWSKFLDGAGAAPITSLNDSEPEFVKQMQTLVASTSLDDIKVYLRWSVMNAQTLFLPKKIDEEAFDFYGRILTGRKEQRPRWKRCVDSTDASIGEALGQAYVERAFAGDSKERTLQMVAVIEKALQRDIADLPWMTETTKQQALVKLRKITNKIGYPDRWRDYSNLQIVRGDAMGTPFAARNSRVSGNSRRSGSQSIPESGSTVLQR